GSMLGSFRIIAHAYPRHWHPRPAIDSASWPHPWRLDGKAFGARHQVKLEIDEFGRAEAERLRPYADHAVAQPPLQRADRLPFRAVDRIAGRMRLRDGAAAKALAPVVVVARGAGEVELPHPPLEQLPAVLAERVEALVLGWRDRHAARLQDDVGGDGEQVVALAR